MEPKLEVVRKAEPRQYRHLLSAIERRAYQAAWRILEVRPEDFSSYAIPSTRRSMRADRIARIIAEEMSRVSKL